MNERVGLDLKYDMLLMQFKYKSISQKYHTKIIEFKYNSILLNQLIKRRFFLTLYSIINFIFN